MKNDDRDELDDLIEGALPGYSNADPREGLEERVLHRVQAACATRRSPWLYRWGFAIPALAALLFAVGMALRWGWNSPSHPTTDATRRVAISEPPSPAPAIRMVKPKRGSRTRQGHNTPLGSLPKEACFPSPVPITEEERTLVAWVARAPEEAARTFADLRARSAGPIAIQPIQIPPLHSDGAQ